MNKKQTLSTLLGVILEAGLRIALTVELADSTNEKGGRG